MDKEKLRAGFEAIADKYEINISTLPGFEKSEDEPYKYAHTNFLFSIFREGAERASNPASPTTGAAGDTTGAAPHTTGAGAASPAPVAAITDLLHECKRFLEDMHSMPVDWTIKESQPLHAKVSAALSTAPQAQAAQPDNVHELDAAMSLLRVARKIDASKVSPAALRKQLVESVAIAEGAEGEGEGYIFADVYENLSSMIAPYVHGGERDAMRPFPASVVDTFTMLLEHYLATATPAAPVATSEQAKGGA